ncbi:hypothetical protein ACT4US_07390, partial [Bacillus sp. HC-Mk]
LFQRTDIASQLHQSNALRLAQVDTSVSESFCVSCTRARISADGKFYTCLFATEGLDVRELLRGNLSDEELLSVIQDVWMNRKDRYSDERTEESAKNRPKIEMSYIGG